MSFEKSNPGIKRDKFWKSKVLLEKSNAINFGNQNDTIKPKRIFPFNQRQDIKIVEDKKRIRQSKFYF